MSPTLKTIFSFSIVIAALISWIRLKKINPAYYPFILLIWIGLLNELISYFIIRDGHSTAFNNNIYSLLESLLILLQFERWGLFNRSKYLFVALLTSLPLFWVIETFFVKGIDQFITYFRIYYSFLVVLMSINIINEQLISERKNI